MRIEASRYISRCIGCNYTTGENELHLRCPRCGNLTVIQYIDPCLRINREERGVWRYASLLPRMNVRVSMGEGSTPITRIDHVLVKNERYNPTGSYADRASALIASYLRSNNIRCVRTRYERDFTRSLIFYLTRNQICTWISHIDLLEVDPGDILHYVVKCVHVSEDIPADCLEVDYISSLSVEGLKTIVFELFERNVHVDYIVVPTTTGLLAYSLAKGLADLRDAGADYSSKIVAVVLRDHYDRLMEFVKHEKNIIIEKVSNNEAYESMRELVNKGYRINPLVSLGYLVAKSLKNSIAVLTMGYKSTTRETPGSVRKVIIETLKKHGSLSAYEIWRLNPQYTLRAYYKVVESMEKKGELCSEHVLKGQRRVKKYYLC